MKNQEDLKHCLQKLKNFFSQYLVEIPHQEFKDRVQYFRILNKG